MIEGPVILEVTTLGRFEIRRQQDLLSGGNWNRRKVCDLFKLLITAEQHRLHREQIQELLWPASASEQAASSFGKTLYLLRRALEPALATGKGATSKYVTLDHDALMLVPDTMRIDADIFEAAVKQLQAKLRNRTPLEAHAQGVALLDEFDRVLSLYGGDFLPEDLYEDWTQRRRDRLRRAHSWLLENAAEVAVTHSMGLRASEYLQALLERNPLEEQAHRQLMLIYARMGRRSEAVNQFQLLREILREELRTNPLPETIELYRTIQAGRITVDLVHLNTPLVKASDMSGGTGTRQTRKRNTSSTLAQTVASDPSQYQPTMTGEPGREETEPAATGPLDPELFLKVALVGREDEMLRLQRAYTQVRQGQRRVIVISGEPGIGKTRLAREITAWAEQKQRAHVLWGYCYEMSGSLPYQPIVNAIESYVHRSDPAQLRQLLGNSAGDLAKIVPEIRSKLPDLPPAEPLGPEVERRNLYNAVAHFFNALAQQAPLTIILDDLQWADIATMQLLSYLTALSPNGTLPLYILLYRADEVHESHPLRGLLSTLSRIGIMEEVRLKRLSEDAVRQMVEHFAGHPVLPIFASEIFKHTEGNPFFVGEALLSLIQEGKVKKVGDHWETVVSLHQLELPQSVRLLIERRLVHFSPDCRTTLALAAVLGRQFSSALLCKARNLQEDVVAEHVDDAIRLYILVPFSEASSEQRTNGLRVSRSDIDLTFTHDKIREVLYQRLNPLRRRSMHRQVAHAIEDHYTSRLQSHYSELAYHYQMAEEYAQAVNYFLKAARQAAEVYAFLDTAGYMERTLDLLIGDEDRAQRAELLRQLAAEVYLYIGRPDKAIEAGLASCALWRDLGDVVKEAETRLDLAFAFHWQGRDSDAIESVIRALECLEQKPGETRLLAKAYVQWGLASVNLGDTVTALKQLQRADELHATMGGDDLFISVVSLWARSWYCFLADTPTSMLENALRAADVCRRTHRYAWEPMMTYSAAWAYMLMGRIAEGFQTARDTLEKAQRHNAVGAQGWAYLVLAFLVIQQGHWDEAEEFADKAVAIAGMLHDVDLQSRVLWSHSVSAGWQEKWERAIHYITEALQLVEKNGETSMVYPYLLLQAAKAHFQAGRFASAQRYLDQSMQLGQAQQYRQLPAIGQRVQGRILHAQRHFEEAQPYFEQSLAGLAALGDTLEYARTEEAYGLFYYHRGQAGDEARGQALLDSARATFARLGVKG